MLDAGIEPGSPDGRSSPHSRCPSEPAGPAARAAVAAVVAGGLLAAAAGCGGSSGGSSSSSTPGPVTITVSHGYTDVEAKEIKAQADQWNTQNPDQEGQPRLQRRQRQRAAEDHRRLHRRQLPRRRLRVRLVRRPARPPAEAGRPHQQGQGPGLRLERLLPLRAAGGHRQRQGRRHPGPGRQPRPRLQQEAVRGGRRRRPRRPTGPGRTSATRPRSSPTPSSHTYGWAYVNDGSEDTVWRYLAMLWQAGGDLLNSRQHRAGLRLAGRAGRPAAAAGHGRHRQVGLPRHRQRQLPQPVQQRQDRDALDRALGPVQHQQQRRATA